MSGRLDEVTFCDLCQALSRPIGMLRITGTQFTGRVFFAHGRIVHGELGALEGRVAVVELAALTEGQFAYFRDVECGQETIEASIESILMEAALYVDYVAELSKRSVRTLTFLELTSRVEACCPSQDSPQFSVVTLLRKAPRNLWDLLNFLSDDEQDRAEAAKVILDLVDAHLIKAVEVLAPANVGVDWWESAFTGESVAHAPLDELPKWQTELNLKIATRQRERAVPVEREPAPAPAPKPAAPPERQDSGRDSGRPEIFTQASAAPRSGTGLWLGCVAVVALVGGWYFMAPQGWKVPEGWSRRILTQESKDALDAKVGSGWSDEVDAAISAAGTFVYGSFAGTNSVPMSPADLARFHRTGISDVDLFREIKRRGFTGFPDSIEEERVGSLWGNQVLAGINKQENRLTQTALELFIQKHPITMASGGLNSPTNSAAGRSLKPVLERLEQAIQTRRVNPAQATILSLKLLLLRQRVSDLATGAAT